MFNYDLTGDEVKLIEQALKEAIASAVRAQRAKSAMGAIVEVYKHHENLLRAVETKIKSGGNDKNTNKTK